jgi:hypothetical protein
MTVQLDVKTTAMYYMTVVLCSDNANISVAATGTVALRNPFGYIAGEMTCRIAVACAD